MRKLAILGLAVALVMAMSAVAAADYDSIAAESVDANIIVNQYSQITIGVPVDYDGNALDENPAIDITDYGDDPGGDGMNNQYAIYWPIDVRSNDDIEILLEETVSEAISADNPDIEFWPYTEEEPDMTVNLSLHNEHKQEISGEAGEKVTVDSDSRTVTRHVTGNDVGPGTGFENWTLRFNASVTEEGLDKITPDTYGGEVTVTVVAAN